MVKSKKKLYGKLNDDNDDVKAANNNNNNNNNKRESKQRKCKNRKKSYKPVAVDDHLLREKLCADGTKSIVEMASDGNCLFRSLSDQLYHDFGNQHAELRSQICDYLEGHQDDFAVFLLLDDHDEDIADFESYVSNMRSDGSWGGNVELVAAARVYRRNITVYSTDLSAFTMEHGSPKPSSGPDLILSYHDNLHYNSVRDNTKPKPPPPIRTYSDNAITEEDNLLDETSKESSTATSTTEGSTEPENDDPNATTTTNNKKSTTTTTTEPTSSSKHARLVKKNDLCPCGSHLRFKKCCLQKEKHAARLKRLCLEKKQHGALHHNVNDSDGHSPDETAFRVLKI